MTRRRLPRRRWIVLGVGLVALVVLIIRLSDVPAEIAAYRVVDDHTLELRAVAGPATWTRVTGVTETATQVLVYVGTIGAPLPGTGGNLIELTVRLHDPINGRQVIDGNRGVPPEFTWDQTTPASPQP